MIIALTYTFIGLLIGWFVCSTRNIKQRRIQRMHTTIKFRRRSQQHWQWEKEATFSMNITRRRNPKRKSKNSTCSYLLPVPMPVHFTSFPFFRRWSSLWCWEWFKLYRYFGSFSDPNKHFNVNNWYFYGTYIIITIYGAWFIEKRFNCLEYVGCHYSVWLCSG